MHITPQLRQQMVRAVQTSMRIEGVVVKDTPKVEARAAELMKQQHVQVSVPSK